MNGAEARGIPHQQAIKAQQRAIFRIIREGGRLVMSNGQRMVTIPRHDPVNAFTMAGIVSAASLTEAQFRALL